jgi:hypothetical protein
MCSIIVWDLKYIILLFEENWSWGDIVLPILYIWWGVMRLWKWYANLNIFEAQMKQQTIPSKASPRFVRTLSISLRWSTLARNILNALTAKRNYATRTDWKLTINSITQYRWIKGYFPIGFYHLLASLTLSHHGLTTVGAPEWPLTSCQLLIYS